MCLSLDSKTKPKVAKRDIVVYKTINFVRKTVPTLMYDGKLIQEVELVSAHRSFKYELGKKYKSRLGLSKRQFSSTMDINEGLHWWRAPKGNTGTNSALVKCIVPKGSTYYLKDGTGVSNQLIIKEIVY